MSKRKKIKRQKTTVAPAPGVSSDRWLWGILAAALAIRLLYLYLSRESPFFEPTLLDPAYYDRWAKRIVAGDWLSPPVFYGLPLYPFFLAACYKLAGASLVAVKVIQIFLGLGTLYFIYKIGEKIASRRAALAAVLFGTVYGPLFHHEAVLIPEALGLPLYAASFYGALRFLDEPGRGWGLRWGFLSGLAALTKAGIIPFVFLFSGYLILRNRKTAASVFIGLAAFFATLAPVAAHNFFYGHDRVILTSHAGFNFYIGNNPEAEGTFKPPAGTGTNVQAQMEDSRAIAERELGHALKPSEVSRYWSGKAWAFIRENPGKFFELCLRKLILAFDAREISDVNDYAFEKKFNPMLRFPWPGFGWIGPLAILGLLFSLRSSRYYGVTFLWAGGYLAGLLFFFVNARYRLPLLGVFLPAAGAALVDIFDRLKKHEWGRAGVYTAVLLGGVFISRAELVGQDVSKQYTNAGDVYLDKKEFETAKGFFTEALGLSPDSPKANVAMGVALTGLGRDDEAKDYYLKALSQEPNAQAYNNLGLWYDKKGESGKAEEAFLKAIELKPYSAEAYNNLGMIYGNRQEYAKAQEYVEKALSLDDSKPRYHSNLGLLYYKIGRREEALSEWRKALSLDPAFEMARRLLQAAGQSNP